MAFLGHIEAARPLLSSIEAEPALLSSSECTFIAQWICTLYPVASRAIDEPPPPPLQVSAPLATLTNTNGARAAAKVPAEKRRKSMLPAPRKATLPPASGAVAAHHPAAAAAAAATAPVQGIRKGNESKAGSKAVNGLQLRQLERGQSGVGATAIVEQLRSALAANLGRVSDLFREWDADGNGRVSKAEFHNALATLGLEVSNAESSAIFDSLDDDGSGSIEFGELNSKLRRGWSGGGSHPAAASMDAEVVVRPDEAASTSLPVATEPVAASTTPRPTLLPPAPVPPLQDVSVSPVAVVVQDGLRDLATPAPAPTPTAFPQALEPAGPAPAPPAMIGAVTAPSRFGTLDFAQHFAAPRFEHPEGSISGSPIIDDDATVTLLGASAAAAAAYDAQLRLDGHGESAAASSGVAEAVAAGVEAADRTREDCAACSRSVPLSRACAEDSATSIFGLPGARKLSMEPTPQLTSPPKSSAAHCHRRGSQGSASTISTPSFGGSPPKSIGKVLLSSSRVWRGARSDVHDSERTPEMDDTHMYSQAAAGPTPELRSPPKSLKKPTEGPRSGGARSGGARSGGGPVSAPRFAGALSAPRSAGALSAPRSVGCLSAPRSTASWAAALASEEGGKSGEHAAAAAVAEPADEEAFMDALESPVAVPPPAWEVGPTTPLSGHQLRLTPARVARASEKVAGARSLQDDGRSYEAQWIASAKKSSARRKSCLKATSRYSPAPERLLADDADDDDDEACAANGLVDGSTPTAGGDEEEDSTQMVAEKGADAMAAILAADDTLTVADAAAMVPDVTLSDVLPLANTPSKLRPGAPATPRGTESPAELQPPRSPLDLGLFPVTFQKGKAAEQLSALHAVLCEARGALNINELCYLLHERWADQKFDHKRIALLLEVLQSRKAVVFEGHGAHRSWALP